MEKIKCVHIITKLELGGAQDNTLYTAANLNPDIYDVYLICGPGGILDAETIKNKAFKTIFVNHLIREISPVHDFLALCKLISVIRKIKPKIVHTHSSKAGILGRWAAWFAGVPVIIHTFHGFGFNSFQKSLYSSVLVFAERLTSIISTALIAVSLDNKNTALANGIGRSKVFEVIHSGVRRSLIDPNFDIGQVVKLSRGELLVTNISCLKHQKKPTDFVELANILINEYKVSNIKFCLIGDGELRNDVELAINKYGLSEKVYILGWRRDANNILARSDFFILTSLWEGLPRALVEAMNLQKPCLVYRVDGINDIVKDGINGYSIPVENVRLMAEKLKFLIENPEKMKELGENAKNSIDDSFYIENMVKIIEKFYGKFE